MGMIDTMNLDTYRFKKRGAKTFYYISIFNEI